MRSCVRPRVESFDSEPDVVAGVRSCSRPRWNAPRGGGRYPFSDALLALELLGAKGRAGSTRANAALSTERAPARLDDVSRSPWAEPLRAFTLPTGLSRGLLLVFASAGPV